MIETLTMRGLWRAKIRHLNCYLSLIPGSIYMWYWKKCSDRFCQAEGQYVL
jgi:hypothetical protein